MPAPILVIVVWLEAVPPTGGAAASAVVRHPGMVREDSSRHVRKREYRLDLDEVYREGASLSSRSGEASKGAEVMTR